MSLEETLGKSSSIVKDRTEFLKWIPVTTGCTGTTVGETAEGERNLKYTVHHIRIILHDVHMYIHRYTHRTVLEFTY